MQHSYFCHQCQIEFQPPTSQSTDHCPNCNSDFIEQIESENDPREFVQDNEEDLNPFANPQFEQLFTTLLQGHPAFAQQSLDAQRNRQSRQQEIFPPPFLPIGLQQILAQQSQQQQSINTQNQPQGPRVISTTVAIDGLPPQLSMLFQLMAQAGNGQEGNPFVMGRSGDYVFGDGALDDLLTQLMEQHAANHRPPPASQDTIAHLPSIRVKIENLGEHVECAICQDEYKQDEQVKQLPCNHLFHPNCIENWLKMNGTCPICRFSLVASNESSHDQPLQERE